MSTSFELTLDDTSPVVSYFPFAETLGVPDVLAGWNSYFSQSGFLNKLGQAGLGTSMHITSHDGAALTIQWFGTGISLFGNAVEAPYEISLDGAAPSLGLPRGDRLAEVQGLQPRQHVLELIAHPTASISNATSFLAFEHATLNVSAGLTGATVSSEVLDIASPHWLFSGDWAQLSDPVLASQPSQSFRRSTSRGNTASIAFSGSAVSVMGIRNVTHGHYNVSLDGTVVTLDGRSDWLETSTLFLRAGLDEAVRHTLVLTNADNASLAISGLNVTHVSGGTPISAGSTSGLATGTIIALTFSGILGMLAMLTILICILLRRRRRHDRQFKFPPEPGMRPNVFRDLNAAWPPKRRPKHRPTHLSKNSDYDMQLQDLHTAGATRPPAEDDSPIMDVTNKRRESLDPTSPAPYLRLSKISTFKVDFPDSHYDHERARPRSTRESYVPSAVCDLFDAHSLRESGIIDPAMMHPASHPAIHPVTPTPTRRRNTDAPQRLRVQIPHTAPYATPHVPRSATAVRPRRSPLLLVSPQRGSRRNPRRASFGAGLRLSPSQETPATVSTMQFVLPGERVSGSQASERTVIGPPPNGVASELLEQLRARWAQRNVATSSHWEPPW